MFSAPEPDVPASSAAPGTALHLESGGQVVSLDAEGIFRARSKPKAEITLEHAQDIIRQIAKVNAGARRPILVDLTGARSISRDARQYFAGPETAKVESAAALLVHSPLSRVLGNFFMGMNKALTPTRLFTSEPEALAWLRGFLP